MNRRDFLKVGSAVVASAVIGGCGNDKKIDNGEGVLANATKVEWVNDLNELAGFEKEYGFYARGEKIYIKLNKKEYEVEVGNNWHGDAGRFNQVPNDIGDQFSLITSRGLHIPYSFEDLRNRVFQEQKGISLQAPVK